MSLGVVSSGAPCGEDTPIPESVPAAKVKQEQERDEEEEESDSSDNEEEEEDEDEEDPEEIARRLGDQLWADIQRARAGDSASSTTNVDVIGLKRTTDVPVTSQSVAVKTTVDTKKKDAALATMKVVLAHADSDSLVQSTLKSTPVPSFEGSNIYDMLKSIVASGSITKHAASCLSQVLVKLAKSVILFPPLPILPPSALKRKREVTAGDQLMAPAQKRLANGEGYSNVELEAQIMMAVEGIARALEIKSGDEKPLSPSVIATIQPQLHQAFLFAVTSSTAGGEHKFALQEASGLIQILGVLSGILIIPPAPEPGPNSTDIITAVYPCLHPDCSKTFARLYSLRQHQRTHTNPSTMNRPYKCKQCPASFSRNHDLKRHVKVHEKTGFQCGGCGKIFSRRDAIKRHRKAAATARNGDLMDGRCEDASVEEVEVEDIYGLEDAKEDRRARMWSGMNSVFLPPTPGEIEEGEVSHMVLAKCQAAVTGLVPLLQAHVARALSAGNIASAIPTTHNVPANTTQTTVGAGQATLASVIARATAPVASTGSPLPAATDTQDSAAQIPAPTIALGPSASDSSNNTNALSGYVLNADQTKLLEQAIAQATAAAQAQAEAEAALEEGDEEEEEGDKEEEEEDMDVDSDT